MKSKLTLKWLTLGTSLTLMLSALSGCALFKSVVSEPADGPPAYPKDISLIPEPIPRFERKSDRGNPKVYKALGKTYRVWNSSEGYRERGKASWYGTKWVGRPTSSGEAYDLYQFTGAHRNLPLPTYAKVTNLKNRKSVIIKINDRGPFHGDRIVDLSYAAAAKIGIVDQGTADVEVEAINPRTFKRPKLLPAVIEHPPSTPHTPQVFQASYRIQVGAFQDRKQAEKFQQTLHQKYPQQKFEILEGSQNNRRLYRVESAPLPNRIQAESLQAKLNTIPSIIQIG